MGLYSRYVLPRVVHLTCGAKPNMRQRQKIVPTAKGRVLEVGVGIDVIDHHAWPGLRSVVCVESQRSVAGQTSYERRFYITSLGALNPTRVAEAVRGHWGIENRLHWCLDVSFGEDQSRIRLGHSAENYSRLRRLAINLLRRDSTRKIGLKGKMKGCGWDHDYLLKVLGLIAI